MTTRTESVTDHLKNLSDDLKTRFANALERFARDVSALEVEREDLPSIDTIESGLSIADGMYPDDNISRDDLRQAFAHGYMVGYCTMVFGDAHGYDRLQSDAYITGVQWGEREWVNHNDNADDDDDYDGFSPDEF